VNAEEKAEVLETYGYLCTGVRSDGDYYAMIRPRKTGVFAFVSTGASEGDAISAIYITIYKAMREKIYRKNKGLNPI